MFYLRQLNSSSASAIIVSIFLLASIITVVTKIPSASALETYVFAEKHGSFGTDAGQFYQPNAVILDPAGNIYVSDTSNHRVQKFTSDWQFILQIGTTGTDGSADGQLSNPAGIESSPTGDFLYVVDFNFQRIKKFDSSGNFITKWGTAGSGNGEFQAPHDVAVDSAGNVYVTDGQNSRVQKFDSSGNFITKWGTAGSGNGQFFTTYGIAIDASDNVYVTDLFNSRVQKFTADGSFIMKWDVPPSSEFRYPLGVDVDTNGDVFVTDFNQALVYKFTNSGTLLAQWGGVGSGDGFLNHPIGISIDSAGRVYVADSDNNRIQIFVKLTTPSSQAYSIEQPINSDGSSLFKLGSTVPIKIKVLEQNGDNIPNLTVTLRVAKITDGILGTEMEAGSTAAADSGNTLRFSQVDNIYIYNLATKDLSKGTWALNMYLNYGQPDQKILDNDSTSDGVTVLISLK